MLEVFFARALPLANGQTLLTITGHDERIGDFSRNQNSVPMGGRVDLVMGGDTRRADRDERTRIYNDIRSGGFSERKSPRKRPPNLPQFREESLLCKMS
jgi:hypothetical protein